MTGKNPLASFYANSLAKIEKETKLVGNSLVEMDRLSTSILTLDWLLGGGLVPTIYQFSGEEASAKTTTTIHSLASAIKSDMAFTMLVDAEGTSSPKYVNSIFKPFNLNVNDYLNDRSLGLSYYRSNVIDRVFDNIVKRLDLMPSKTWSNEAKQWMYIFPKRDAHFSNMMTALGVKPDKTLSTDSLYYAPAAHGGAEAFIAVDSWAAMLPESEEEAQAKSNRRAIQAQAFSDHLKRVAAKIAAKGVTIIGINQLRKIPGQTYGDPLYEPCGEALKFFSGARLRFFSRSPSAEPRFEREDKTSNIIEPSAEGVGFDRYMLKEVKNTKNKFGNPHLKSYIRVWVADYKGSPRGVDPVYDTIKHLESTNQGKWRKQGKKQHIQFNLKSSFGEKRAAFYNQQLIEYSLFKLIILAEYTGSPTLLKTVREKDWKAPLDFRSHLFKQMQVDPSIYLGATKESKEVIREIEEL